MNPAGDRCPVSKVKIYQWVHLCQKEPYIPDSDLPEWRHLRHPGVSYLHYDCRDMEPTDPSCNGLVLIFAGVTCLLYGDQLYIEYYGYQIQRGTSANAITIHEREYGYTSYVLSDDIPASTLMTLPKPEMRIADYIAAIRNAVSHIGELEQTNP